MKKFISLFLSLATVASMMVMPAEANDGEKVIATYPITAKSDFYRVGGASSDRISVSGGKATVTLPAAGQRYTIKENLIGENIGKGGSYRIEMDVKLSELIKASGFEGDVNTQTAQILMYQDGNSGLKSENYISEPTLLTLGADAVTLTANFDYNSTLSAVPRSAALQFVADEGQITDGKLNYYPKFEISAIRLVEVTAPSISVPVPVKKYWKTLNVVDFEDCKTLDDVKKYYRSGYSASQLYGSNETGKCTYINVSNQSQWKHYSVTDGINSELIVSTSKYPELKVGVRIKLSAKVMVASNNTTDTLEAKIAIKQKATQNNPPYIGESVKINKDNWTTIEHEVDFQAWNGISGSVIVTTGGSILVDEYRVELLKETTDDTFTFNNKPVARIFSESLVGNVAGVGEKTYPYVAKLSVDEIGGSGKVIFATYVGNLLSEIVIKDASDAVDGFVTHSININKIDNAEINIICFDNLTDINYLCDYKGIKAE